MCALALGGASRCALWQRGRSIRGTDILVLTEAASRRCIILVRAMPSRQAARSGQGLVGGETRFTSSHIMGGASEGKRCTPSVRWQR